MQQDNNLSRKLTKTAYILGLIFLGFIGIKVLEKIQHVVILFAVSVLMAYILAPMVNYFCKKNLTLILPGGRSIPLIKNGLPRIISILVSYIIVFAGLFVMFSYVMPLISQEYQRFVQNLPLTVEAVEKTFTNLSEWFSKYLPRAARDYIAHNFNLGNFTEDIKRAGFSIFQRGIPMAVKVMTSLAFIFIVPLLTFYLLLDVEIYRRAFLSIIPPSKREEGLHLILEMDRVLGRYIRGQLLVCLIIGISVTVVLSLWGIEYALLIGFFSGIIDIIPYVGVAISYIPAFFLALSKYPFLVAVMVLVSLQIVHWAEGKIIVPTVVGHSIGLPPLAVILSLMVGAELMGLTGMFLAVPAAAMLKVIVNYYLRQESPEKEAPSS
ncbi:MAG: AI-2E family transporter [bacterium]